MAVCFSFVHIKYSDALCLLPTILKKLNRLLKQVTLAVQKQIITKKHI